MSTITTARQFLVMFRSSLGILLCAEVVVAMDYRSAIQFVSAMHKDLDGVPITQVTVEEIKG